MKEPFSGPGWQGRFRGCGYRMTAGREAILQILQRAGERHLSAEDIYLQVREQCPGVGLATVYRTLDILAGMGVICKFDFGDGRNRYELAQASSEQGHHHHLICTECKRIINYHDFIEDELELLKKTEKGLSEKYQFAIRTHVIQFYGLCRDCGGTAAA